MLTAERLFLRGALFLLGLHGTDGLLKEAVVPEGVLWRKSARHSGSFCFAYGNFCLSKFQSGSSATAVSCRLT